MIEMGKGFQTGIDRFTDYFGAQIDEISHLKSEHGELYQKLLFIGILDTLAGSVAPRRKNRDRFIYFVRRFCRWPDGERVSLPHLVQLLRKNPDPVYQSLREWALAEFEALPVHDGELMSISHDPLFDEVKREWPASSEHREPIDGIDLTALRHIDLLYIYRNMLVHELRTPGYGMEFGADDQEPFYHGMSTIRDDNFVDRSIELVYPRKFLHRLCDTGLLKMKEYLVANRLDPFDSIVFGTYWIRALNT